MSNFLHFGGLRAPIFGVFAAAGLILALWLSQSTAQTIDLHPGKLWDAGMFMILAGFVISRGLLILQDPRSFLHYPLIVLALPSFTYGGMLLTALLTLGYLRWKALPLLRALDAWVPCAALLDVLLQVGHLVEGTDGGIPTREPWGICATGYPANERFYPVQLYAAAVAFTMCGILLYSLRAKLRPGLTTALALTLGGLLSFLLGLLRQPVWISGHAWLDPSQWIALAAILAGACLWLFSPSSCTKEAR